MSGEPNYYQLLGIEPTADQAAIDAAYQGRSLRFRLGQLRDRARALPGPTQEEVEKAYAVLGNPESRALYDAAYFPEKAAAQQRRRVPVWLLVATGAWVLIAAAVCVLGVRSRLVDDGGAIGRFVVTNTPAAPTALVAAVATQTPRATPSAAPTTVVQASVPPASAPPPTATVPLPTPTSAAPSSPSQTFRPTETAVPSPTSVATATSTRAPTPTATVGTTATVSAVPSTAPPAPTAVPPTPTPEPPPPPPEPTPTPEPPPPTATPTPTFQATDRIGTVQPVNLRAGPGTNYAILRALPQGTLLRATGESAFSGGFLWRRFLLAGGGDGWVRDIDVLPAR